MIKQGFHYMAARSWRMLNHEMNDDREIRPRRRMVRVRSIRNEDIPGGLPDRAHDGYIFAFPDLEAPKPWKKYENGVEEWRRLTEDIADEIVAVRFDVLPEDQAFVADRAHFADWQYGINPSKADAIRKYALSMTPSGEFKGGFRMPELLVRNSLHLERLSFQGAFRRHVVKCKKDGRKTILRPISRKAVEVTS